jgi:hypothetical protein
MSNEDVEALQTDIAYLREEVSRAEHASEVNHTLYKALKTDLDEAVGLLVTFCKGHFCNDCFFKSETCPIGNFLTRMEDK